MSTAILNGFEGFYHGLAFSFPFSVPVLVCLGRLLLEGFFAGFFAILGTLVGQLCFFFLILNGTGPTRNVVYFWYTIEPFLAFIGFVLCFKLATDFMSGSRNRSISILNNFSSFCFCIAIVASLCASALAIACALSVETEDNTSSNLDILVN